jgi:hypothetical protein
VTAQEDSLKAYRAPELSEKASEHIGKTSEVQESGWRWVKVQKDDRRFKEISRGVER